MGTPARRLPANSNKLSIREGVEVFLAITTACCRPLFQELANLSQPLHAASSKHFADSAHRGHLQPHDRGGFPDTLTHVHSRRHAERVQDDIDWGRHFRQKACPPPALTHRDHTLVTVTAGHLVTRLNAYA